MPYGECMFAKNVKLELTQFALILAEEHSNEQLTHLDDLDRAYISIFLLPGIELNPPEEKSLVSTDEAPATEFLDLSKYENIDPRPLLQVNSVEDLLQQVNNVQIWGPHAAFVRFRISSGDVVNFISTMFHKGPGNGGGSKARLVVFLCYVPSVIRNSYQEVNFQILAPEMLLLFYNVAKQREKEQAKERADKDRARRRKRRRKRLTNGVDEVKLNEEEEEKDSEIIRQLLIDWVDKVGFSNVLFNYQVETKGNIEENYLGEEIIEMLEGDEEE